MTDDRLVFRMGVGAFALTFMLLGLVECNHRTLHANELGELDRLRTTSAATESELESVRRELFAARAALAHQDAAFADLVDSHLALQELHRESMQWGPLRSPRDCVREVVLMDETAWPMDRDAELAYYANAYAWSEQERTRVLEELDRCFDVCFPSIPGPSDSPSADANSSWIDWPENHVVQRFPTLDPR